MTYMEEIPNGQSPSDPPLDGLVPPPDDPTEEERTAEAEQPTVKQSSVEAEQDEPTVVQSLAGAEQDEPTVVLPLVAADQDEPTVVLPAGATEDEEPTLAQPAPVLVPPPSEDQPLQPTAVMPQVPAEPSANGAAPPTEALVPPPTGEDTTLEQTDDFTMSDVTFSDVTLSDVGDGIWEHLRSFGPALGSVRSRLRSQSSGGDKSPKATFWGLPRWQFGLVVSLVSLIVLFIVFIAVDGGLYYDKIHPGVKVAGRSLSGLDREEAVVTLDSYVEDARTQPITLTSDTKDWDVLPDALGTTVDLGAAVDAAFAVTRDGNALSDFGKKLKLYFSSDNVPLQGIVDSAKMDALLDEVAGRLDQPAANARLVIVDDNVQVVEGEPGLVVDREALRTQLTQLLFTFHSTELPIPMMIDEPDVAAVDITPALAKANVMIGADLELTHEGKVLATFTPRDIASYMDIVYEDVGGSTTSTPVLSPAKMTAFFDSIEDLVAIPGKNATLDSDGESVWVVPGADGEGLDREATASALTDAAHDTSDRTAEVLLKSVPPELTTEEVQAMGITDLLAAYATTPYKGTSDRQHNVRLGTSKLSGTLLAPGEEFNTDKRLGPRNAANGWQKAPGIVGFGEMEDVYGGGICQVSTTLFNAVLEAGLQIVERHNHSIYINHYPKGRDATVTAGGKNMRFKNDTDHYIFIYGESTGIVTKFYVWGVDDGRSVDISVSGFYNMESRTATTVYNPSLAPGTSSEVFSGQSGRSCLATRTVTYSDGTTHEDNFYSHWPMMPSITEVGPAATTTTAGATTTTTSGATTTTSGATTTTTPTTS